MRVAVDASARLATILSRGKWAFEDLIDREDAADTHLALGANHSRVEMNQLLDQCEANARPLMRA